jgi:integrase
MCEEKSRYTLVHDDPSDILRALVGLKDVHVLSFRALDGGSSPGTARIRQLAVRRFAAWLTAGGEIHSDPFPGVKAPHYEPPLVEPLTDAELRALIATCAVPEDHARPEDTLNDRREEAIIPLMFETAIRSGELVDLQLIARVITIRRGKCGEAESFRSGRRPPRRCWSTSTSASITRWRPAATCGSATEGKRFGREGLSRALRRRATRAGVDGFRPHRLRHTAAHRWLAADGSESGLLALAGWTRSDMLVRYTRARASERAAEEARRLNLGAL